MTSRMLCSALGFSVALFSLSAAGQMNYGTPGSPAAPPMRPDTATSKAPAATTSAAADTASTAAPADKTMKKHAHHARHATPSTATSMPPMVMKSGSGDPAYHAALKQCMAGPTNQRDACLDNAITRYGQS